MTTVTPGATVVQHPRMTTVYSLPFDAWGVVSNVSVGRVRPETLVPEASARRVRTLVEVAKGIAGADYEIWCGTKSFRVKVSAVAAPLAQPTEARTPAPAQALPIQLGGTRPRTRR